MLIRRQRNAEGMDQELQGPTVMYCNPNAVYYEYAHYFKERWVEFYIEHGFNLFMWNYRGYGRSEGFPTPHNLLLDAEQVARYLRDQLHVRALVVHGESIGGVVATHVAAKCGCEMLCADRTFGSLRMVVEVSVGNLLTTIFGWVTRWQFEATESYLHADCYKLLACDPNDTLIPELASLKSGVALALVPFVFLTLTLDHAPLLR